MKRFSILSLLTLIAIGGYAQDNNELENGI